MDQKKAEALLAQYEHLTTVKRLLAAKSPTWTFNVGATHKDGNQFESIDVPALMIKGVLTQLEIDMEAKIKKLGGAI